MNNNKLHIKRTCPDCGNDKFVHDESREETYCKSCGMILECPPHYVSNRKINANFNYTYI